MVTQGAANGATLDLVRWPRYSRRRAAPDWPRPQIQGPDSGTSFGHFQNPQQSLIVNLWRRRVLPPGPEGLHPGCYVRVRRFDSHTRVGPPTGRPGCQPSLCLAFGPEDAARPQSPLSCRFPRP